MAQMYLIQVIEKMGQWRARGRGKVSDAFIYDLHVLDEIWDNREAVLEKRVKFQSWDAEVLLLQNEVIRVNSSIQGCNKKHENAWEDPLEQTFSDYEQIKYILLKIKLKKTQPPLEFSTWCVVFLSLKPVSVRC